MQARWRLLVAGVILTALPGSALAQPAGLERELERTGDAERQARDRLDEVRDREGSAREVLEQIRTELDDARAELDAQRAELAAAEAASQAAEQALTDARARRAAARRGLADAEVALAAAEAELDVKRGRLELRVRAAFKYGNVSLAEVFTGVRDYADLVSSTTFVAHVLDGDRLLVEEFTEQLEQVEGIRAAAQALRREADREAELAGVAARELADALARIEVAAAEQARVTRLIAAREAEQVDALEALRDDREAIEGHLAGLQAESSRIERQLAAIAREQAAEAARQEAARQEQRRRAEAAEQARREAEQEAAEACDADPGCEEPEPVPEPGPEPEEPAAATSGAWLRPVGGHVTSPFGPRWGRNHNGVDLAGAVGTPVLAARGGTVVHVVNACHPTSSWGCGGGFGNYVTVAHDGGYATIYAHLSTVTVGLGASIAAGQQVGAVGNSGNSYGPHLHFEVRIAGVPHNPCGFISC